MVTLFMFMVKWGERQAAKKVGRKVGGNATLVLCVTLTYVVKNIGSFSPVYQTSMES